ncbi:MAG: adenylate/guanylate cyclase domain-containing protein [Deltaproteobacteria bacterium]|nr:adenylate/guanylate cyclase domain-containing protein [Deltaproteobacteria bacterium]
MAARRKRSLRLLEGLSIGLGCAVMGCALWALDLIEPLDRLAIDFMQRSWSRPGSADPDIVLVAIDDASLKQFKEKMHISYPWPRDAYGLVLDYLQKAGCRGVIFDLLMSEIVDDREEVSGEEADQLFAETVERVGGVTLGAALRPREATTVLGSSALAARMALDFEPEQDLLVFDSVGALAPHIAEARARFGYVNAFPDDDGLIRRAAMLAEADGRVVPCLALAALLEREPLRRDGEGFYLGERLIRTDGRARAWIRFHGPGGAGGGQGETYRYYPIYNVLVSAVNMRDGLEPEVDPAVFKDKWVLVGSSTDTLMDLKATPYSLDGSYPGMEIHATILDNLLHGDFLWRVSPWLVVGLAVLLCMGVGVASQRSPLWAALAFAASSLVVVGFGFTAFAVAGMVVDLVSLESALLLTLVAGVFVTSLRERRGKRRIRSIFQYYLDPGVVRQLLDEPERVKLGGERRLCTVFFSDIAGFTTISEQLSPEQLVEMMNRYLGAMTDIIIQRGGFLDKYVGDAIMAVFGAPADLPGHAEAACLAALDCHARLETLCVELGAQNMPTLRIRVGINTGDMIVGNMGSARRMNYTVMGDAVNLASRLEGVNKEFGTRTIVGPMVREQVGGRLLFRELDLLRVKGKQEPVRIHELVGPTQQQNQDTHDRIELFSRGLRAYREQKWSLAKDLFEQLLARWPDDGPTMTYMQRCLAFQEHAPASDWDGIFVMTRK